MKLKKLQKQGKKQAKKEEVKQEAEQKTKVDDDEQQRDDALIDIKQDIKKKQQSKPKVPKRVDSNKLDETQINTANFLIEKKQETKKILTTWVVEQSGVKDLLQKDFKLHEVQDEFESLTDTKLNQQLKQKKFEKSVQEKKVEQVGQMKFAPLAGDPLQSRTTDKIVFGKPKTETPSFGIPMTASKLNFTNSKLDSNVNVAPIERSKQQLYDDEYDRKATQRLEQSRKEQQEVAKTTGKGNWFKKTTTQAPKQAPKIEFKSTPMAFTNSTFTNSALTGQSDEQPMKGFKPLEKSKQQQIYQRKQQDFVFVNKKQQEERRKKREEELKIQSPHVQVQPTHQKA